MSKYRILYVGQIDEKILTSTHMFSFGIIRELTKLDVDLVTFNSANYTFTTDFDKCISDVKSLGKFDFVLCHLLDSIYLPPFYDVLKKMTNHLVTMFIEVPVGNWKFDMYYLYQDSPRFVPYVGRYKVYPAPIIKDQYINVEKEKNSILLDHRWQGHLGTNLEISDKIMEWIKDLSGSYKIYKLMRYDEIQPLPDFIIPIPHMPFKEYLKAISNKEIFISTHAGSYNSTVIDMICFGAKCIIPKIDQRTYIPVYNIDLFNLPLFSNKNELINEIKKPINNELLSKQIDKCSDIRDIIGDIDKQFTKIMEKK